MRVLQIHKDFQPLLGGGGTARHIHGLARALSAQGCDVRVIAPDAEDIRTPYVAERATVADFGPHLDWADVVHVHGARSSYAVRGARGARRRGKPFFYTPHAFYTPHNAFNAVAKAVWDRTAEKFLLEKGAQTILLTDAWFDWLKDRGISAARTSIIPNCIIGADLIIDAPPAPLAGKPAILSVGRFDKVKRIDDVIRALAEPALAHGHLHLVGKGVEREALEALAKEKGVADRVTFHGFVDDAGVASMMTGAHAFVLASEQEGLPTVLLEALMAGLPVVCSRIPGNLAIMGVAGIDTTYDVGDVSALARLLAASPDASVSTNAVEKLRQAFTWESRANEIRALYQASLDRKQVG
ncbi:glycosyltransferase family 4 protein [Sphingomonas sp.]|uniref:glycosyltransferase family 4 protein n=1 Tax=Sphingomonas sp. TaxID=28214 RepID=UPI002C27B369|nr:glycosyltransferase family 4 protein [Sphingomonas sp.]HTG37636.1 glycosyltransferase family 4 protein [Sphingomonas sp.]